MKRVLAISILFLILVNCDSKTDNGTGAVALLAIAASQQNTSSTLTYSSESKNYYPTGESLSFSPEISNAVVSSYSISSSLPTGVSMDVSSGIISGTPTIATAYTSYTVTATTSGGGSLLTTIEFGTSSKDSLTCSYGGVSVGCTTAYPYTCTNSASCFSTSSGCQTSTSCEY